MNTIRVVVKEIKICEVEYICEVNNDAIDNPYGIGEIDSIGGISGADAMGFYCKDIMSKVVDGTDDCEMKLIEWEIL